jgi:WD40 repeat protein
MRARPVPTIPVALVVLLTVGMAHGQPAVDALGDPLPPGAGARLGTDRFYHSDWVEQVLVTPDGKHVVSCGRVRVRVWETATGRECPLAGGKVPVGDIRAGAGMWVGGASVWLLVIPETGPVTLVDAVTGDRLARWERDRFAFPLAVRPDGRAVAMSAWSGRSDVPSEVRLWDAATDTTARMFSYPPGQEVSSLTFSPDGRRLAVGRRKKHGTDVWDAASRKVLFTAPAADSRWTSFTPDGKRFVQANGTGKLRQWDAETGRELPPSPGLPVDGGRPLAFDPTGRHLVFTSDAARFVVVDVTTGKAVRDIPHGDRRDVSRAAVYTPDGKRLITADGDDISVWDPATGRRLSERFHTGDLTGLAWSPDGRRLATTAAGDAVARVWDAASGKQLLTLTGHAGGIGAVAWSPDGARLATWDKDQTLRLWTTDGRETARAPAGVKYPDRLDFTPAGHLLAVASGGAVVWDPATAAPRPLADPPADIFTSALVADGTALVVWHHGRAGVNNVSVRDAATGKVRVRQPLTCEYMLAASPDARAVLCRQAKGDLELVSLLDGRRRWTHPPAKEDSKHPAHPGTFSPDGRTVAVSRDERGLRILEVATGAERTVIRHPTERVYKLAFSPDGTRLAAAGGRSVLIWDVTRPTVAQSKSAEAAWADLASPDAAVGFAAVRAWVAHPAEAIRLARERVSPIPAPDGKQVAKWIEQLDAPRFAVREAAMKSLTDAGERVIGSVQEALKGLPSPEARQRLETVLAAVSEEGPLSGERLRAARVVEAMERIGTADAKRELERLAAGATGAGLTRDAAAALGRLKGR